METKTHTNETTEVKGTQAVEKINAEIIKNYCYDINSIIKNNEKVVQKYGKHNDNIIEKIKQFSSELDENTKKTIEIRAKLIGEEKVINNINKLKEKECFLFLEIENQKENTFGEKSIRTILLEGQINDDKFCIFNMTFPKIYNYGNGDKTIFVNNQKVKIN